MGGKMRGPMCSTRCGPGWVDDGTKCRTKSYAWGPLGVNQHSSQKTHPTMGLENRTFKQSIVTLGRGFVHGETKRPSAPIYPSAGALHYFNKALKSFKALVWRENSQEWKSFIHEYQNFATSATSWERRFSPLVKGHLREIGKPLFPVVDQRGTVIGYTGVRIHHTYFQIDPKGVVTYTGPNAKLKSGHSTLHGGDYADVVLDIDGKVISHQMGDYALESSVLFEAITLFASLSAGVVRAGMKSLIRKASARILGEGVGGRLASRSAKEMVAQLRREGKEVVVNIGGEAAEHELRKWPNVINLNPITKGRGPNIPSLVKANGEDIGKIFDARSLDKIVSSKLPTSVDPVRLAEGTTKVLRSGGKMEINIFGSGVDNWGEKFTNALIKEGVRRENIKNLSDVLFLVTK